MGNFENTSTEVFYKNKRWIYERTFGRVPIYSNEINRIAVNCLGEVCVEFMVNKRGYAIRNSINIKGQIYPKEVKKC